MNGINKDAFIPAFVNFSAQTSANQTQVTVMQLMYCAFIQLIYDWSFVLKESRTLTGISVDHL